MKFCLPRIRIQNSSGIVAGTIIKIPILPKLVPMKHRQWIYHVGWIQDNQFGQPEPPVQVKLVTQVWFLESVPNSQPDYF